MEKKEKTRIQWHPGFVAAMNLEFAEQRNEMIMERVDYERLSKAVEELDETTNDEYVDSVLRVSIRANEKKLKEDKSMRFEALKELFEPELTEKWNDGRRKGAMAMANTMLLRGYHSDEIIDIIMQTFQLDRSEAVKYMKDMQLKRD